MASPDCHDSEAAFTAEPLTSLTKDEWWTVCRRVAPDWTYEQFEQAWDEFQAEKAEYLRRKALS